MSVFNDLNRVMGDFFPTPSEPKQPARVGPDRQAAADCMEDMAESLGGFDAAMRFLWAEYRDALIEHMPADTRESIGTDAVEAAADDEGHRWDHRSEAM